MTSADLTPISYLAVILSWAATLMLMRLSARATSLALRERAWASLAMALFVTVFAGVIANVDTGYALFDAETGRIAVRIAAILLALVPAYWLIRYSRGWR